MSVPAGCFFEGREKGIMMGDDKITGVSGSCSSGGGEKEQGWIAGDGGHLEAWRSSWGKALSCLETAGKHL